MKKHLSNIEGIKEDLLYKFKQSFGNDEDYNEAVVDFFLKEFESKLNEYYEIGYTDGENSGHADVVDYLDCDETDWKKAIKFEIDTAKQQTREEIIEDLEIVRMKAIDKNIGIDALLDKLHSQTKEK